MEPGPQARPRRLQPEAQRSLLRAVRRPGRRLLGLLYAATLALAPDLPPASLQLDQVRGPARLSPRRGHRRSVLARFLYPLASRRKLVCRPRHRVLRPRPHRRQRAARYSRLGAGLESVSEATLERPCGHPAKAAGQDRAARMELRGQLAALQLVRRRSARGLPARAECGRRLDRRSRDHVLQSLVALRRRARGAARPLAQRARIEACGKAPGRRRDPRFRLERGAGSTLGLREAAAAPALRAVSAPRLAIAARPSAPRRPVAVAGSDPAHRRVLGGVPLPGRARVRHRERRAA